MVSIHIEDKKKFTSQLFVREDFDDFLLVEASITTFITYTIDGRIQKRFYTAEEYEDLGRPELSRWGDVRKLCFDMIKGSKTPLKFKIVLKLPASVAAMLADRAASTVGAGDIGGLLLNIRFENESIDCITATSLKIFSMDKGVEEEFDRYAQRLLFEGDL